MKINKIMRLGLVVSIGLLFVCTTHASVLEEVIVTAQKREQSLQDVGIAVTAMTGEQMDALGFANAQQITAMAPGVQTVQPNGEANYSIGIRGVTNSDFATNVESPVALYVDEVYVSQMSGAGFGLFDMDRVEILRGPQGTLFGRNATGGLAHFITKKPIQESEGYAKVTIGDYDQFKFEGAVNGAITESLSARLSLATHDNDGYIENRLTGNNLNNANDRAVRLQLLYAPNDNLEVLFNSRRATQEMDTGFFEYVSSVEVGVLTPGVFNPVLNGYTDNDGDNFAGDYDDPGFNDLETEGYTATVKWAINDSINLTSISDFSSVERVYIEDSDSSPISFFNLFLTTDAEQISQELRFDGEIGKAKWVTGLYYLDLEINDTNGEITDPFFGDLCRAGGTAVTGSECGLNNPYTSKLESTSIFGQIEYELSDTLTLIGGLRWISDDKEFDYANEITEYINPASDSGFNAPDNTVVHMTLGEYHSARSDDEVAGRLQLDWNINDSTLVYTSFNRGVKGGGYNAPIVPPPLYDDSYMTFDPEQLDAYEIGMKTDIGDIGRVHVAAYYYDYNDYQIFNIVGLDAATLNSPDAEAKGFEVELQLSPGERWDIILGAAYNDFVFTMPDRETVKSPIQSPEWNLNGMVRYAFPAFGGEIALQADAVYRDEVIFALSATPNVTQKPYTVANISASYTIDNWQFSALVQNVTDEEYQVQAFDLSGFAGHFGMTEQYYGRPRWWSISARYSWGG